MISFEKTAKVSRKGQITLLGPVRSMLNSDVVRLVVEDDVVCIEPVTELAGSLKSYARKPLTRESERDEAWSEAMRDKHLRD